jgi:hypothetical protein
MATEDNERWRYIYEILWGAFIAVMIETRNKEQRDDHRSE